MREEKRLPPRERGQGAPSGGERSGVVLALAFGVLIVLLFLAGSLWIMAHLT